VSKSNQPATYLLPGDELHADEDHVFDYGRMITNGVRETIDEDGAPSDTVEMDATRFIPIIRFSLTETYEEKGAVWTRLTITKLSNNESIYPPIIGPIRVNLMNHTRAGLLGVQEMVAEAVPEWDWESTFKEVKARTIGAMEQALVRVNLAEVVATSDTKPPFLLRPYIASSGVTILYGDGGTGKSVISLALGLEVATGAQIISEHRALKVGPVIYADYEDEHEEHANRLRAIVRAHAVDLDEVEFYHLAMIGKVTSEVKRLRQAVHDTKAVLVILDSIGMGRGGDALSAEDTIRMFRSLRSLGAPVLAVDHVSKEGKKSKRGNVDPYGSIYTRNSSRMMWHVESRQPRIGDPWDYLVFTHTKANHVRKQLPQYLKLQYVNAIQETVDGQSVEMIHSIEFAITDMTGIPNEHDDEGEGDKRITLLDQVIAVLFASEEPLSAPAIADLLGRSEGTIRKCLSRGIGSMKLKKQDTDGEPTTYCLPDEPLTFDDNPDPF